PSPTPTPSPTPSPAPETPPGEQPQRADPAIHDRIVKLRLEPGLVARGRVRTPDGFDACKDEVIVKIVRNSKVVATLTTRADGRFKVRLEDRRGRYVARAPETAPDAANVCAAARSRTRRA
ncbi:MAG TPA: hypothetical protein VG318_04640, partial [Actinomycetota bacterium]|nr:hypothetical protein [Actinomycetota bacterium]